MFSPECSFLSLRCLQKIFQQEDTLDPRHSPLLPADVRATSRHTQDDFLQTRAPPRDHRARLSSRRRSLHRSSPNGGGGSARGPRAISSVGRCEGWGGEAGWERAGGCGGDGAVWRKWGGGVGVGEGGMPLCPPPVDSRIDPRSFTTRALRGFCVRKQGHVDATGPIPVQGITPPCPSPS